jgi:hypothetical protein
MVADLGERLQQLDEKVVALDTRVGSVPHQVCVCSSHLRHCPWYGRIPVHLPTRPFR